jgi:hypothetical protein
MFGWQRAQAAYASSGVCCEIEEVEFTVMAVVYMAEADVPRVKADNNRDEPRAIKNRIRIFCIAHLPENPPGIKGDFSLTTLTFYSRFIAELPLCQHQPPNAQPLVILE